MSDDTTLEQFTAREFRDALAGFATGVTIITTAGEDGEPVGMTASSFNSVSMEPALILWSVTKTALSAETFRSAKRFAVHILASSQVELSNKFAKSGSDKFADTDFDVDSNGVPRLHDTVARFDCQQWAVYEGGDHWIIVGEVKGIYSQEVEALVFSDRSYATTTPIVQPSAGTGTSQEQPSAIDGLLIYNLARAYHQVSDQFHDAVRDTGLSVSEWRILASLYGRASRNLQDLSARTFVTPEALMDHLTSLSERQFCTVTRENGSVAAAGTQQGHDYVEHLFMLSSKQEQQALEGTKGGAKHGLSQLTNLLKQIIANTDNHQD